MGAKQSSQPRSVSMENPGPAGLIDISDDVVLRLKKGVTQQAQSRASAAPERTVSPTTTISAPQQAATPPAAKPAQKTESARPAAPPSRAPAIVYPAAPLFMGAGGATMTASDVRRQKELELQQNDEMWRERMTQLEQTLNKTNAAMEKEYSAAIDDVRARFARAPPAHQLPPCQDLKAKLIACYKSNQGETLRCSEEVANFRNCVTTHRLQRLDDDKAPPKAKAAPVGAAAAPAAKAA